MMIRGILLMIFLKINTNKCAMFNAYKELSCSQRWIFIHCLYFIKILQFFVYLLYVADALWHTTDI